MKKPIDVYGENVFRNFSGHDGCFVLSSLVDKLLECLNKSLLCLQDSDESNRVLSLGKALDIAFFLVYSMPPKADSNSGKSFADLYLDLYDSLIYLHFSHEMSDYEDMIIGVERLAVVWKSAASE